MLGVGRSLANHKTPGILQQEQEVTFRNWQLNRLHLRKRGAKNGEKEPDEAFHVEQISSREIRRGNFYSCAFLMEQGAGSD